MSRVVVGYRDGKPLYRDDGPAVGRVTGFGGVAAGHFQGVIVLPPRSTVPLREKDRRRAAARKEGGR